MEYAYCAELLTALHCTFAPGDCLVLLRSAGKCRRRARGGCYAIIEAAGASWRNPQVAWVLLRFRA